MKQQRSPTQHRAAAAGADRPDPRRLRRRWTADRCANKRASGPSDQPRQRPTAAQAADATAAPATEATAPAADGRPPSPPSSRPQSDSALRINLVTWPDTHGPAGCIGRKRDRRAGPGLRGADPARQRSPDSWGGGRELGVQCRRDRDHLPPARRPQIQRWLAARRTRFCERRPAIAGPARRDRRLPEHLLYDQGCRRDPQHRHPDR